MGAISHPERMNGLVRPYSREAATSPTRDGGVRFHENCGEPRSGGIDAAPCGARWTSRSTRFPSLTAAATTIPGLRPF